MGRIGPAAFEITQCNGESAGALNTGSAGARGILQGSKIKEVGRLRNDEGSYSGLALKVKYMHST